MGPARPSACRLQRRSPACRVSGASPRPAVLSDRPAAIHGQLHPGDEAGRVAGKVQRGLGHVLRGGHAPERDARHHLGPRLGRVGHAQELLDQVGLRSELYDPAFHEDVLSRAEAALAQAIEDAKPLTHIGYAESKVRDVASNRRVVDGAGNVSFARGSSSGREAFFRDTDAGLIDPMLRTISFWSHEQCLVEYHAYATHPMSYYGRGEVSSDFVGLARKRLARLDRAIHPIYASGCSGDVTAGKFNDGSPHAREELTSKIFDAMLANRASSRKMDASKGWVLRSKMLELQYTQSPSLQKDVMQRELQDDSLPVEKRILAAMGLASWKRSVENPKPIDVPCVDFGIARVVLFPGESFVGYQHLAQRLSGQVPVVPIGYGESWTGYVPTASAFDDGFHESWLWVAPGAEQKIQQVLTELFNPRER